VHPRLGLVWLDRPLRVQMSCAALHAHPSPLTSTRMETLKRRLRWLEGFAGSDEYTAQDVGKERDWLREEIRILSDPGLREQQNRKDDRNLARRHIRGHFTDGMITMHPRMMYANLKNREKPSAIGRRFKFICSIPPSPEYFALDQIKESEWLAAEMEEFKERMLGKVLMVWIIVVMLSMLYAVGSWIL
jgi:hypothetical protein